MTLSAWGKTEADCQKLKCWVSLGASLDLTNNDGQTCLDIATSWENALMLECIQSILAETRNHDTT
jgi:hypothetical protein